MLYPLSYEVLRALCIRIALVRSIKQAGRKGRRIRADQSGSERLAGRQGRQMAVLGLAACARRAVRNVLAAALSLALVTGGPVTGQGMPQDPVSAAIAANGGIYADPALTRYVQQVGTRLLMASGLPVRGWRFEVLDTPIPNAFGVSDGTILVTRGMLALADDEAELAAVLGHELGHAISGDGLAPVGGSADRMAQEVRADQLGLGYLAAAGYDVAAQPEILAALAASQTLAAPPGSRAPVASSDHPGHGLRIAEARREMARMGVRPGSGARGREAYLAAINGLPWGDRRPAETGYLAGASFVHPGLGFAFDPPPGYQLENRPEAVVSRGPGGALLVLDSVPAAGTRPEAYVAQGWAPQVGHGAPVRDLRRVALNGLPAAQGWLDLGPTAIDLTVVEQGGRLYRVLGMRGSRDRTAADAFARSAASFRALTAGQAEALGPLRIRVHQVRPGETVAGLAGTMPLGPASRSWFGVINGLPAAAAVQPGDLVKLVGR